MSSEAVQVEDDKNQEGQDQKKPIRRVRHLWRNLITLGGAATAAVSLVFFLSLQFFDLISSTTNPYLGIWEWLVFAPLFVLGVVLVPIGIVLTRWYWLRKEVDVGENVRYPRIDLSDERNRKVIVRTILIGLFLLPIIGLASSKTVHYSSSSTFCGTGCHNVMGPQYTRYLHSPHARIECADCHIGSGTESLIRAKINGIHQVISVAFNSYPRPIPPAELRLRPARETCEECHWPSKYFGDRYFEKYSYRSDEQNTRRETKMILKVGGGDPQTGPPGGIHWHMSLGFVIEYLATGKDLQEIPWVRFRNAKTGESRVYRSDGVAGEEPPKNGVFRRLDCIDCHNRGAHKVESPAHLVDVALETGSIDKTIPYIKREAVEALVEPYESSEEGIKKIPERLHAFYHENYPDVADAKKEQLQKAAGEVVNIYQENFFAHMKVNWRSYPDNIGHKIFAGCFRCHDDKHVSGEGKKLATECTTCHDFISSVNGGGETITGEFQHAILLGKGTHADVTCRQCHTGGVDPVKQCDGACHQPQKDFLAGTSAVLKRFEIEADDMNDSVECKECHKAEEKVSIESVAKECKSCHEDDGKDYGEMLVKWDEKISGQQKSVDEALNKLGSVLGARKDDDPAVKKAREWLKESTNALSYLSKAGPYHNYKASKNVYKAIVEEAEEHREALSKAKDN